MSRAGIIWCAVLLILVLIALLPVGARIIYSADGFSFRIRIGRWDLGGKKKKDAPSEKPPKKKKENASSEKKKKKPAGDTVRMAFDVIKKAAEKLSWLLRRVILQKLDVSVICGGEDAAGAAFRYGLVCASVYPAAGALAQATGAREQDVNVDIRCDYDRTETTFTLDVAAALRVWAAVVFAVFILFALIPKGER